jgi:phosphopentomutase
MKRALILVLDGVGIGELPDAGEYGDTGSNTLANIASSCGGLHLPTMERLGLGNIDVIQGVHRTQDPLACFGKMAEKSPGKDSTSGHWELFGIILDKPFPTYPQGFPAEVMDVFETRIKHRTIGNKPASGTEIIQELGEEHLRTERPIVYTSADSVFQIACHVDVFSIEELYEFCRIARDILVDEHAVGRVIARPFTGTYPDFRRTKDRRDFSLQPPEPTLLDLCKAQGYEVIAIGKIDDLMGHRGYTRSFHSVFDMECVDHVINAMSSINEGLIVANFVQFDMDWGHRNDVYGFRDGLVEMDNGIKKIIDQLREDDLLFITADHGNDPTTPSTDHSREYVPLLALSSKKTGQDLGIRESFSDLAQTISQYFGIKGIRHGKDFLKICLS